MNDDIERIGEGLIQKTMKQLVATLYLGKVAAEGLARANADRIAQLEKENEELKAQEKQDSGSVPGQVRRLQEVPRVLDVPEPG